MERFDRLTGIAAPLLQENINTDAIIPVPWIVNFGQDLGKDHVEVGQAVNLLALSLVNNGRAKEAESLHRRALDIYTAKSGAQHIHTAQVAVNLADCYRRLDRNADAEKLYHWAVPIYEKEFGKDHVDVSYVLNGEGLAAWSQGRFTEAEAAFHDELQMALHLYLINRGILITPFHNMTLCCPSTTEADVDRLIATLDQALGGLLAIPGARE